MRTPNYYEIVLKGNESYEYCMELASNNVTLHQRNHTLDSLTFGDLATELLDAKIMIMNGSNGRIIFQGSLTELLLARFREAGFEHEAQSESGE